MVSRYAGKSYGTLLIQDHTNCKRPLQLHQMCTNPSLRIRDLAVDQLAGVAHLEIYNLCKERIDINLGNATFQSYAVVFHTDLVQADRKLSSRL